MDLCQIFSDLSRHLREHDGLVQLKTGDLQMGNVFHSKDQIFVIVEIQFRKILRNNDVTQFHIVIFQGSPVHRHVVKIGHTSIFPGLLQNQLYFAVTDAVNKIDIAVAILFQRTFSDGGNDQRLGKVKVWHFFFQIVCNILFG